MLIDVRPQQTCNKAIVENVRKLETVPDCYKNQTMCDKAVDNYPHALIFVPDCYVTQKMCEKAVNTYRSTNLFLIAIRLKECVMKLLINVFLHLFKFLIDIKLTKHVTVIYEDSLSIFYCPDKCKTQRMCDEAVANCLAALKLIPDWFVASKMFEKLDNFTRWYTLIRKILIKSHLLLVKDILAADLDKIKL